jgi:hypothetical protein
MFTRKVTGPSHRARVLFGLPVAGSTTITVMFGLADIGDKLIAFQSLKK